MTWSERKILFLLGCLLVFLSGAERAAGSEVMVSAALSLKAPFEEIGRLHETKYSGSKARFNFAASGILQKQIEAGAPTDVFAAASPKEMDALEKAGLLVAGSRRDFAGNTIVLITAISSHLRIASFNDLGKSDIKRIAIGNPASVPAGKYAEETLITLGLHDTVKTKLIYAEHVRQVMDYVARNEVDAGIVFLTDVLSRNKELKVAAEAPESSHKPVVYTAAVIKGSKNAAEARRFISLVISGEGREILRKHGFRPVP